MSQNALYCIAGALIWAIAAAYLFRITRPGHGVPEKRGVLLLCALPAVCGILAVLELSGAAEITGTGPFFAGLAAGLLLLCAGAGLLRYFRKNGASASRHLAFFIRLFTVLLALELFFFNFNSYKLMSGAYPEIALDLAAAQTSGFEYGEDGALSGQGGTISFEDVGIPVGTLYLDVTSDQNAIVSFSADISDETYGEYRSDLIKGTVNGGDARSRTVPVNVSGDVGGLRIRINAAKDETITVRGIALNSPIPLRLSPLRFGIIFIFAAGLYMLLASSRLQNSVGGENVLLRKAGASVTAALIFAAFFLTILNSQGIGRDFTRSYGDQMTKELVDAFKDGQVHLHEEPSEELLALENPYDWSQRRGVHYLWDHLLYEGKYYSYYGIAPVVLVFLPYHLLTGYYFPALWAIFLFGAGGIFFLSKTYMLLVRRFFPKVSVSQALAGLLILQLSSGIWYCFPTPKFYEIAQSSGFLCVTAGAYFLLRSNAVGGGRIRLPSLCAASCLLALGVLCLPTAAVYCAAALLFIAAGAVKQKKTGGGGLAPYLLCALLPFALFGGVQMLYNYVRFGSFTDFGIQYSLTINDFTKARFHAHFAALGFFNYLLAFPKFIPNFPFFTSNVELFNPNGYYFVATDTAMGLAFTAPPSLALLLGPRAYKKSASPQKRLYALLLFAVCVAAPAAIIFSVWESGYGMRYLADFGWQIVLGGLIIAFALFGSSENAAVRRIFTGAMAAALGVSIVLNFAQVYNWAFSGLGSNALISVFSSFARLFEFWL